MRFFNTEDGDKTCMSCVHFKWYKRIGVNVEYSPYCTGVTLLDGRHKQSEWISDLNIANTCKFFDNDSWVK
jgi:Zn-finger nucleic acid-binding protein